MTENAFKYAPGGLLDDISTFDQLMTACNIHRINIGSGNGLGPDGTKPLPGSMLNIKSNAAITHSNRDNLII